MIGASVMQTWGAAGISQWIRGSNGESCDTVCISAGLACVGNDAFPQQLTQTVTDALFAQDETHCYYTSDSTDSSAPFFSDGNRCFRGTGTSTCSASSSSSARLCPCSNHLFPGLVGSIATSTLQTWTAAGVREWKLGSNGQSCNTVCSNAGLACSTSSGRFPQQLSQADTNALFAQFGTNCYYKYSSSDNRAPFFYNGNRCYRGTGTSTSCSASSYAYSRLCA